MTLNNILSIVSLYKLKYSDITFTNDATYTDKRVCLHRFLPIQTYKLKTELLNVITYFQQPKKQFSQKA